MDDKKEYSTLVMRVRAGETIHVGDTQMILRGSEPRLEIVFVAPRDTKIWRSDKLKVLKVPQEGHH